MSQPLAPCPSCNRHVFADACVCPFCAAKLRVCQAARAPAPNAHMSRAARIAAGAALAGVAACSSGSTTIMPPYGLPPPPHDASTDVSTDARGAGGAGGAAATADASTDDASTDVTSPSDAAGDRSVVPVYGAAAPVPGKPVR